MARYGFENHKVALLRAGALIVLGASTMWLAGSRSESWRDLVRSGPARAVLALFAVHLVATVLSIDPWISLQGTVFRQQGLLTLCAYLILFAGLCRVLRRPDRAQRLVTVLIAASFPVCLYGMVQRLGLDPLVWEMETQTRISSTLGNPIFLGAYVAMLLGPTLGRLCACLLRHQEPPIDPTTAHWRALAYLLLVCLQGYTLWATRSRGPILAAIVAIMAFAIGAARHGLLRDLDLRRAALVALSLVIGASLAVLLSLLTALPGAWAITSPLRALAAWALLAAAAIGGVRLLRAPRTVVWPSQVFSAALFLLFLAGVGVRVEPTGRAPEAAPGVLEGEWEAVAETMARSGTARNRMLFWQAYHSAFGSEEPIRYAPREAEEPLPRDALHALRPWIGLGPEVGGEVFQQHYPEDLARRRPPSETADRAHNEVWDILVTTGILGLAVSAWLLIEVFWRGFAASGLRTDRGDRGRLLLRALGLAGVCGSLVLLWSGPTLIGVAVQTGFVLGLLGHLVRAPLHQVRSAQETLVHLGLLAGLLCHVAETTVGFGTAATRLCFWMFAALLVVAPSRPACRESTAAASDRQWLTEAGILGLLVGVLAQDFLGPEPALRPMDGGLGHGIAEAGRWAALPPRLTDVDGAASAGGILLVYVGLLLLPWVWTCVFIGWEATATRRQAGPPLRGLGKICGVSLIVFSLAWLAVVSYQSQIENVRVDGRPLPAVAADVLTTANVQAGRTTLFYLWAGATLGLIALGLADGREHRLRGILHGLSLAGGAGVVAALVTTLVLPPLRADVLTRAGLGWRAERLPGTERLAVVVLRAAALEGPGASPHWYNLAEAAAAAVPLTPPQRDAPHPPGKDLLDTGRFSDTQIASLGPVDLFALARVALEEARRCQAADPLLAWNRGHLWARWSARRGEPAARSRALAWYEVAREMLADHPQVQARIDALRNPASAERGAIDREDAAGDREDAAGDTE